VKRGYVAIILVILLASLIACEQRGQAVYPQYPQPIQRVQSEVPRVIIPASLQPTHIPSVTPTQPVQNKECRAQCNSVLQICRSKSQPPFSKCVDSARTEMKNCLTVGDDSYCRLEYSKIRTICFNSFMAGCDILFNTCAAKC
jgi:hypothetical protein